MLTTDEARLDQRQIHRAFSRAARTYDSADFLQTEVRGRLLERLPLLTLQPRRILDLGCGTGRALPELAALYPRAELVACDFSEAMSARTAGKNLAASVCAAAENLPFADGSFDLVFSSLMLHWSPALDRVFGEVRRVLRYPGVFHFATLGPASFRELRRAWAAGDALPHVMPFPELRALGDGLLRAGLAEPVMDRDVLTIQYRTVGELLSDLRNTGATNASADRERGLMGKARYARMADAYPKTADGSLPATLEILSGQAWTPAPEQRRNPSGEVSVALSAVTGLK